MCDERAWCVLELIVFAQLFSFLLHITLAIKVMKNSPNGRALNRPIFLIGSG